MDATATRCSDSISTGTDADHRRRRNDLAAGIDKAEDHHAGVSEDVAPTAGIVVVPGSGVVHAVGYADPWVPDRGDLKFTGYVVELTDDMPRV